MTLLDRLHVDERPDHRAALKAVGDLHRTGDLGEALGERVIDAVPQQDAVGRTRRSDRHFDTSRRSPAPSVDTPANQRWLEFGQPFAASGFVHFSPENREKSRSVVQTMAPCSSAIAARTAP